MGRKDALTILLSHGGQTHSGEVMDRASNTNGLGTQKSREGRLHLHLPLIGSTAPANLTFGQQSVPKKWLPNQYTEGGPLFRDKL